MESADWGSGERRPSGLRLIPVDAAVLEAIDRGYGAFEEAHRATLGDARDLIRDIVARSLAHLPPAPPGKPWHGYLAVAGEAGPVVGTCAFKGPPSPEGTVEIAYYTFPMHESRGHGTAMARALMEIARAHPGIRPIAHTLPERSASTRILEKLGLRLAGEVLDPEDGRVWRWELPGGPNSPGGR